MLTLGTPYVNSRQELSMLCRLNHFTTESRPDSDSARIPSLEVFPKWRRDDQHT